MQKHVSYGKLQGLSPSGFLVNPRLWMGHEFIPSTPYYLHQTRLVASAKGPSRTNELPNPRLLGDNGIDTSLNQSFEANLGRKWNPKRRMRRQALKSI